MAEHGITPTQEAGVRRWVGSVEHVEGLAGRFARLVVPAAVALEIAMERAGEIAMTDSTWKAGDESGGRSSVDGARIDALIARIVSYVRTDPDVNLNAAAEALVLQAEADAKATTLRIIPSTVSTARPG